jgi:hypothetical protein
MECLQRLQSNSDNAGVQSITFAPCKIAVHTHGTMGGLVKKQSPCLPTAWNYSKALQLLGLWWWWRWCCRRLFASCTMSLSNSNLTLSTLCLCLIVRTVIMVRRLCTSGRHRRSWYIVGSMEYYARNGSQRLWQLYLSLFSLLILYCIPCQHKTHKRGQYYLLYWPFLDMHMLM